MTPWNVHPFHRVNYLLPGPDRGSLRPRDLSTKLPPVDAGAILVENSKSTSTSGGVVDTGSQVSSFSEHDMLSFSTHDTPYIGLQPSPDEPFPIAFWENVAPHTISTNEPFLVKLPLRTLSEPKPMVVSPGAAVSYPDVATAQEVARPPGVTARVSCCGCGEESFCESLDALTKHIRCLLCNTFHHLVCLEYIYGFVYRGESDSSWMCPACSPQPPQRWYDSFIGHFILWEAPHGKTKKLYPAEIISRSAQSPLVILRWYSGNQLPAKLKSKDFQVPVAACIKAFFCDIGQSIGAVRFPIRILEDLGNDDVIYSNPAIQSAMEGAFPSILSIALTARHHPLWDLYQQWTGSNGSSSQKTRTASDFLSTHPVPILPGDAAFSEPLLARLIQHGVSDHDAVFVIARILFSLVALRAYLGLQPLHDAHIWSMWSEGKFRRRLTLAERAFEACTTRRTGVCTNGDIKSVPRSGHKFRIIPCTDPCTEDDSLLLDYPPVHWEQSQDHRLFGPGTTRMPEAMAKPRPQPVKRAMQLDNLGRQ